MRHAPNSLKGLEDLADKRPDVPPTAPIGYCHTGKQEVGTFQIFTSNERTFKTNTKTGETWIYNPKDACWFKTKD